MSASLDELAAKKRRLEMASAQLRADIAQAALALQPSLGVADRVARGIAWLRHNPVLVAAAVVAIVATRPKGLLGLAKRGWLLWLAFRRLRGSAPAKLLGRAAGMR